MANISTIKVGSTTYNIFPGATVSIAKGGTGATTASGALTNLGVKDYIVEQGTSGNWYYRKWNSGKAECYANIGYSTTINTVWGSCYVSSVKTGAGYPFTFFDEPIINITVRFDSANAWPVFTLPATDAVLKSNLPDYYLVSPNAQPNSMAYKMLASVHGSWKKIS